MLAIPANSHSFEATSRKTAADVGTGVALIRSLISSRNHPRLFDLEVVGKIHLPPVIVCRL